MKVGDDSWGVVGSDRLPQSQEEEEEHPPPKLDGWMADVCTCVCMHACVYLLCITVYCSHGWSSYVWFPALLVVPCCPARE